MNLFFQIAISLAMLFIGLTIVSIIQKRLKLIPIVLITITLALTVGSTVFGFKNLSEPDDKNLYLLKVSKFVEQGNIDEAEEILNNLYYNGGIDDSVVLWYKGRIEAIKGNKSLSKYYYDEVVKKEEVENLFDSKRKKRLKKEADLLDEMLLAEETQSSFAVIEYLLAEDEKLEDYYEQREIDAYYASLDQEEGSDSEDATSLQQEFMEEIYDNIDDDLEDIYDEDESYEELGEILDLANCVNDYYNGYVDFEALDIKKVDNIDDAIEKLEDYYKDEIGDEVGITEILVESYLLSEEYKEAVNLLTKEVSVENVAILSEIYIKGYIDEDDIEELFDEIDEDTYEMVIKQYEKVVKKLAKETETEEEEAYIEHLENIVEVMEAKEENIHLAQMQDYLEDELENMDEGKQSNYYIQNAKIDHFFKDEEGMKTNVDSAMTVAPYCEDEELANGLISLKEITDDEGDSSDVKDIPVYVEQIVESSLEIDVVVPELEVEYDEDDDGQEYQSFSQSMTNYISEKIVAVNINRIDTSNYPEITTYFQLGSQNEAAYISDEVFEPENVGVFDTGMAISDYEVEKIEYDESNFVLLFDMSGSMSEEISDLKDAGYQFVNKMGRYENVAIVGFSDNIIMDSGFQNQASFDELINYIDGIYSDGGTNIYGSANYCLDMFPNDDEASNVLIVMTDGQDGAGVSWSEISATIGSGSFNNGVTIYTVGLGIEVDADYLTMIAEAGNGKFVYVYDANSLDDFYDFLHGQITNQYKITYTVENQDILDRDVELSFAILDGQDIKTYSINTENEADSENGEGGNSVLKPESNVAVVEEGQVTLGSLDQQSIVKSRGKTYNLTLIGSGFSNLEQEDISLELRGPTNIDMEKVTIVDDTHISFMVPEHIIVGDYDLRLNTGKEKIKLSDAITVIPAGNVQSIAFGDYTIMASNITTVGEGAYIAKGNVNINNLVRFKGDLDITGDYEYSDILNLQSDKASYMTLDKKCDSFFAQVLSDAGVEIPLGIWDDFNIYKGGRVDEIPLGITVKLKNIKMDSPTVTMHPDYVDVKIYKMDIKLPYENYLVGAGALPEYKFETDTKMRLMTNDIAFIGNLKVNSNDGFKRMKVLKSSLLKVDEFEVKINTLKGTMVGKVGVSLNSYKDIIGVGESNDTGFSFEIGCKEWRLDQITLGANFDVPVSGPPVPTTLNDFVIGASDLSKVESISDLGKATFVGGTDINIGDLEAIVPGIGEVLDNTPCVLQVDDARASITIDDFALKFTGAVKLFEQLEMTNIEIIIGNYQYSENILNIDDEDVVGVKIGLTSDMKLEFEPIITLQASGTNTLYANSIGLEIVSEGQIEADVKLGKDLSADAKMLIAINNHNDQNRVLFHIYAKGNDSSNNKTVGFYVILNKGDFDWLDLGEFAEVTVY